MATHFIVFAVGDIIFKLLLLIKEAMNVKAQCRGGYWI